MRLALIVAVGRNRVIGDDRGMPWHLPADLRRFKAITMGKPVILGRKTHALIGRPLPGRDNVILTRSATPIAGCHVAHDAGEALRVAEALAAARGVDEIVVAGGGEVYRLYLDLARRVYLTLVEGDFDGTATFPLEALGEPAWRATESHDVPADAANSHAHRFRVLERA